MLKLEQLQELSATDESDNTIVRSLLLTRLEDFTNALLVIWEAYSLYAHSSNQSAYDIPDELGVNLTLLFGTLGHHPYFFQKLQTIHLAQSSTNASLAELVFNTLCDKSASSQKLSARFPDFVSHAKLHMLCVFDAFPPRTAIITRYYFRSAERILANILTRQLPNFASSVSTYDAEGLLYTSGVCYGGGYPEVLAGGTLVRTVQSSTSKQSLHTNTVSQNATELSKPSTALLQASFWLLDRTIRRSSNDTSRVALASSLQDIIQSVNIKNIGLSLALLRQQDNVWPLLVFSCMLQPVWTSGRTSLFLSQPRSTSDERIIDVLLPAMIVRVLGHEYCSTQVADALEGAITAIALPGTANFEILLRQMCSSDVTSALEGLVMCATYLRASGQFLLNPVLAPSCKQLASVSWSDALEAAASAAEANPHHYPSSSVEFAKKTRQSLSAILEKGCSLLDCLLALLHLTAGQSTYAVLRAGYMRALRYVPDALGHEFFSEKIALAILDEPCRILGVQSGTSYADPDSRVRVAALSTWIYIVKTAACLRQVRQVSRSDLLLKYGFGNMIKFYMETIDSAEELSAFILFLSPARQKEYPRVPVHTKALCDCAAFDSNETSDAALHRECLYALFETSDQIVDEQIMNEINKAIVNLASLDTSTSKLMQPKEEALRKLIEDALLRSSKTSVSLPSPSKKLKLDKNRF